MKILLVGFNLSGAMGDNFKYLVENLPKYDNRVNEWFVLTTKTNTYKSDNVDTYCLDYNKHNLFSIVKNCFEIKKIVDRINPSVIFITTPNLVYNLLLATLYGKRLVYYLHDPIPHEGEKFMRKALLTIQNKYVADKARDIIVASDNLMQTIKSKAIRIKTSVIELGLLDNLVYPQFKNNKKTVDMLFFGRIEEYKGLDVLVKALYRLKEEQKNYSYKVIGKGDITPYELDFKKLNVRVINNYISDKDLALELSQSKVVVLPYKNATGSQTIQAANYYYCPVIASDVGCFVDYIVDKKTGLLFHSGDEIGLAENIKKMLDDNNYKNYTKNLDDWLESKFSTRQICNKYYMLFDK